MQLTALAAVGLTLSVVALIARARPLSHNFALIIAVGAPYVPMVALAALVASVLCRRISLSIVAAAIVTATLLVQMQWYYFGRPAAISQHADIRVLSSNLRKGQVDASSFVRVAEASADVITVSELTREAVGRFSQVGIDAVFPYSVLIPAPATSGIGIYSRFPLAAESPAKQRRAAIASARVRVPGVRFEPLVASVHVISPVAPGARSFANWRTGIASIRTLLDELAATAGSAAVIVAGDFNSTPDLRQFRDLLTNGYRDAVEQTGSGFAPTFPSDALLPPLITLDHVLTRQAAASSIRTVEVPQTDHRSLLATVAVPLDPTAS
jgi:endonuclease/exonuclease/phosphatase (EEP) superfamily protein YafD